MRKIFRLLGAETDNDVIGILILAGFLIFVFAVIAAFPWPNGG